MSLFYVSNPTLINDYKWDYLSFTDMSVNLFRQNRLNKMIDKILQPFFTTKKGTQGTGLGLSITNDIIKAQGGNPDTFSQPRQTIFIIKL